MGSTRLAAVALVLIIPALMAAPQLDRTRIFPSQLYWPGNLAEFAANPGAYPLSIALTAFAGSMAVVAGLGLRRIAVDGPASLGWGRFGLIVAGAGILASAALKARFYVLALEWRATGVPWLDSTIAFAALGTHGYSVAVAGYSLIPLAVSLVAVGWGLQQRLAAPRWVRVFPITAVIVALMGPIGLAVGPLRGVGSYTSVSAVILTGWLSLLGAYLARRRA